MEPARRPRYFNTGADAGGRGSRRGAEEPAQGRALLRPSCYPHLRHDEMADQAQLLSNMAYREPDALFEGPLKGCGSRFGQDHPGATICPPHRTCAWSSSAVASRSLQVDFASFYFQVSRAPWHRMLSLNLCRAPAMPSTGPWCRTPTAYQAVLNYPPRWPGSISAHRHGGVPPRRQRGSPPRLRQAVQASGPWFASVPAASPGVHQSEMFARCRA